MKMANEKPWMQDEEKLVDLWGKYPCLFDSKSKDYSNRELRRKAVEEIAFQLDRHVDDITRHMASLRTSYGRAIKCPPSGSGIKPISKRQEWLLKRLNFLRIFIKARESTASLKTDDTQRKDSDQESIMSEDKGDDSNLFDVESEDLSSTPSPGPSQPKKFRSSNRLTPVQTRPGLKKRKGELKKEEIEALKSIAKSLSEPISFPPPATPLDDIDLFGKLVSAKLRKIQNVKERLNVCNKIHILLIESEMSQQESFLVTTNGDHQQRQNNQEENSLNCNS